MLLVNYVETRSKSCTHAVQQLFLGATRYVKMVSRVSSEFVVNKDLRETCCKTAALFKVYINEALKQLMRKCAGMGIVTGDTTLKWGIQIVYWSLTVRLSYHRMSNKHVI